MTQNSRGFWVPQVEETACVHCDQCRRVCPMAGEYPGRLSFAQLGVVNPTEDVRGRSASGGLFSALAETLYKAWGADFYCFGAAWDEKMNVIHREAQGPQGWEIFRGSKYVQSDLRGVYPRIAALLEAGKAVLFTGTGCQCAGLRQYLAQKRVPDARLYVVDIICHGVPSGKLWQDYLQALERENGQPVIAYTFRDKTAGWRGLHIRAMLADGRDAPKTKLLDSYGALFGNLSLNESCYQCPYAQEKRVGDLTLGDYWGIEHSDCPLDDGRGVSLCLLNTKKGRDLWERAADDLLTHRIQDDSYLQPRLRGPVGKNILCGDFWQDLEKLGYEKTAGKYTGHSRIYRALMKLGAVLRGKGSRCP